ncbi:MAG: RNA 2',3'-cyclic phosphodiesterase [Methylovulum sp.]|nr:RNA 2',3'-cyclic phosphodiesterase [Methylovulum sp.]
MKLFIMQSDCPRLFLALWPDDGMREALVRVSQSLQALGCKAVEPENFHVTLVFLGHVNSVSEGFIKQGIAEIAAEPFMLTFDQLSYWPRAKVICLTCQQPAQQVVMLAAALNSVVTRCGLSTDTRPYVPHVTLSKQAQYLPDIVFEPVIWHARSFCLVESVRVKDSVCYEVVQEWPFCGNAP